MKRRPACHTATLSLALGALVLGTPAAQAAATLVATTPARYEALTRSPSVIQLHFSEAIVKKTSGITLTDVGGHPVRVTPVKSAGDSSLAVKVAGSLGPGVYMVHFTAVSAVDGSKSSGRYQFTVH